MLIVSSTRLCIPSLVLTGRISSCLHKQLESRLERKREYITESRTEYEELATKIVEVKELSSHAHEKLTEVKQSMRPSEHVFLS